MLTSLAGIFDKQAAFYGRVKRILRDTLQNESNAIDIGGGTGKMLDIILDEAPRGEHYVFEPDPGKRKSLIHRYVDFNCHFSDYFISNKAGTIVNKYRLPVTVKNEKTGKEEIRIKLAPAEVKTEILDNILPETFNPALITVNVADNVNGILTGGERTIKRSKPHIVLEYGLGNNITEAQATEIYLLLAPSGLRVSTFQRWLHNKPCFTQQEFITHSRNTPGAELIAYP